MGAIKNRMMELEEKLETLQEKRDNLFPSSLGEAIEITLLDSQIKTVKEDLDALTV